MERAKLEAVVRSNIGSNASRALRKTGMIPAVVYGEAVPNGSMEISLDNYAFERAIAKNSADGLFDLSVGEHVYTVHNSEIQKHPVKRTFLNVDLHQIEMNMVQTFRVPVVFVGNPVGVKEGGILEIQNHHVEISCLPNDLPEKIEHNISSQGLGDVVYARDLVLPENITLDSELMLVLTTINEVHEDAEDAEDAVVAEPEMIREKKIVKE
jgi:large subunit ribosomal protein L25